MIDIEGLKKLILSIYTDKDLVRMDDDQQDDYIFGKFYNTIPLYFNYHPTNENFDYCNPFPHKEDYDPKQSFSKLVEEFKEDSYLFNSDLYTEYGVLSPYSQLRLTTKVIPERIKKCLVLKEHKIENISKAIVIENGEIETRSINIERITDEALINYNEDLPVEKFDNFIESDKSGIALMHGIPGSGKSYFLRYLINKHRDKNFIYFDKTLLGDSTSVKFNRFLDYNKNSILILEDCEQLIKSRNLSNNYFIHTLLNISDGLDGDDLNIKFILTFNTDYSNIDTALTRKGRLRLRYEFKKLTVDRVKALFEKFNINDTPKPMALCDIYNYFEETGAEDNRKKLGF